MTAIVFFMFALLLIIGVPISVSLAMSSLIAVTLTGEIASAVLVQKFFRGVDSFPLMAVPFFILAGNIMAQGGVSKRLTDLAAAFVGRLTGGLAMVSTISCTIFGAISGSAPATTAAIGAVMIEPMQKHGYSKEFAAAVCASSGTIGLLIPPSISMVLYGTTANVSIGKLFMGGIIPGIMMCVVLMITEYFISKKRGYKGGEASSLQRIWIAFKNSVWALLMPVIILGGIYGGIFTPTEAAVVSVFYGLFVGFFIYKELTVKKLLEVLESSVNSISVIMFLVASAKLFSYLLVSEQIPQKFAYTMLSISDNLLVIQMIMMVALLFVGCFLDNAVSILLLTPIFVPVLTEMGVSANFLVEFGVILVLALAIGQVTPPVGNCLFVACNMGKVTIEDLSKECIPFIIVLLLILLVLNLFPGIISIIPNLSGL